jgi:uncharacterized membrane protein YfcA
MNHFMQKNLQLAALLIGAIGGLCGIGGMAGAFLILPYEMRAMEKRVAVVELISATNHDILLRIDEHVKFLAQSQNRNP